MARLIDRHHVVARPAPLALLDKVGQRRGGLDESGAASMGGGEREPTTRRGENFFSAPLHRGKSAKQGFMLHAESGKGFFYARRQFHYMAGRA